FTQAQNATSTAILRGPAGERVRISSEPQRNARPADEARSEVRALVGQVARQFREMEVEFGRPLWPLKVDVVATGDVHVSSAMESDTKNARGYVFNYAVISPR